MALVTTIPVSMRTPISAGSESDVLVETRAMIVPVAAKGIATSSTSGFSNERKVATMISRPMAASSASANWLRTVESCANTPPVEIDEPAGSETPASASLTLV